MIVGQGLSGSLLAWALLQRQQKILIIDPAGENASKVAAGLINPVTGMRFVAHPQTLCYLSAAQRMYHALEQAFRQVFLIDKPMLRILSTKADRKRANKRLGDKNYSDFLTGIVDNVSGIDCPHGVLQQKLTGYLKTRALLAALHDYFVQHGVLRERLLDHTDIQLGYPLKWLDIEAKGVIFCEGYQGQNNPWFDYLPFTPVKGEILSAETTHRLPDHIINYQHWLLPLDKHRFRLGASYQHDDLSLTTSMDVQRTFVSSLRQVLSSPMPIEIHQQQVGIRPATQDRLPFIGSHPGHQQIKIFNGFGSKGSLLIPYYCQKFVDHLLDNAPLPVECNINRFNDKTQPA